MNRATPWSVGAVLACAVWLGGLIALGAIVAPYVFQQLPSPTNALLMSALFRRFDRVVVACAVALSVTEFGCSIRGMRGTWTDTVRALATLATVALGLAQAFWFSPAIEMLFREGASRGIGTAGETLESLHSWAERLAKAQLFILVAIMVLHYASPRRPQTAEQA